MAVLESSVGSYVVVVECSNEVGGLTFQAQYVRIKSFAKKHLNVTGKAVLIIGSITPWLELMMLKHGAKSVTSLDYNNFKSEHPLIQTLSQQKLNRMVLEGTAPEFDAVVSFSSLEHSGLGR